VLGVPLTELLWLVGAIVLGGAATGLLAGIFGVGGGAIIVPVLYEIFRVLGVPEAVRMQLCVGTSLAIIAPTSIRSFFAHRAKGGVPVEVLRIWAAPIVMGVVVGGVIAGLAPGWVFKLAFVLITGLIAAKMLFAPETWLLGDHLPGPALMVGSGFVIGLYAALIGVGGGAVSNLFLTLYGVSIRASVGISAGVGVLVSLVGTLGYVLAGLPYRAQLPPLSLGFVSVVGLVLMAPISTLCAPLGARLAHSLSPRRLEIAFGVFLMLVSLRFSIDLF